MGFLKLFFNCRLRKRLLIESSQGFSPWNRIYRFLNVFGSKTPKSKFESQTDNNRRKRKERLFFWKKLRTLILLLSMLQFRENAQFQMLVSNSSRPVWDRMQCARQSSISSCLANLVPIANSIQNCHASLDGRSTAWVVTRKIFRLWSRGDMIRRSLLHVTRISLQDFRHVFNLNDSIEIKDDGFN